MFLPFLIMPDLSMQETLSAGDKIFYLKSAHQKRNAIVVYQPGLNADSLAVKREIGLPGDTVRIFNSILYINGKRLEDEPGVSYKYIFKTDSIINTSNFLINNSLKYNFKHSYLGVFSCVTNMEGLKIISSDPLIEDIKREVTESTFSAKNGNFLGSVFYWNADNLGPIIIPRKGMQVKIGRKALLMYKEVIEHESGALLSFQHDKCFLGGKAIELYTFKYNYFFLLNDNRSNYNDSRNFGFVAENQIIGRYLFKL